MPGRRFFFAAWLALLVALLLAPVVESHSAGATAAPAPESAQVQQGRYLARVGDCIGCHTAPGGAAFAGGRPLEIGFGVIYTPNITPDPKNGIGGWSKDDFYRAMHAGRDDEGKHLYPAFPYPWFTRVTRADVDAIKSYLDTLAPVAQPNRPPALDWWLRWRATVAGWNLLNADFGTYQADATRSTQWNRGAYLVEGLGHCGDCHTPKLFFGGALRDQALAGGYTSGGRKNGWYAPSLRGEARAGLGGWSVDEIAAYLKTGATARTAAGGPMADVVTNSTAYYSDADLLAVATYLKTLPPLRPQAQAEGLGFAQFDRARLERGQGLFTDQCAACHMHDGAGIAGIFPALAGSSAIQAREAATVVRIVLDGARVPAPGRHAAVAMPAFAWKLDDREVADVVSYIRNAWGNRAAPVEARVVAKARRELSASR